MPEAHESSVITGGRAGLKTGADARDQMQCNWIGGRVRVVREIDGAPSARVRDVHVARLYVVHGVAAFSVAGP